MIKKDFKMGDIVMNRKGNIGRIASCAGYVGYKTDFNYRVNFGGGSYGFYKHKHELRKVDTFLEKALIAFYRECIKHPERAKWNIYQLTEKERYV